MIPTVINPMGIDYRQPLTFTALSAGSSVKLVANGSPVVSGLKYRTRSGSWTTYTVNTEIPLANAGDYVQFWNTASQLSTGTENYAQFVMTGSIAASGNTQSLLNFSAAVPNFSFYRLFRECASLIRPPQLPAMILGIECYQYMFNRCTGLTTPPRLPATTLAQYCYSGMFHSSGLTTPPRLPATTLAMACYSYMFYNSPLTTPPELPATILAAYCYQGMFSLCGSLTTAPRLRAATLVSHCYDSMFYGRKTFTEIEVDFSDWNGANGATADWVYGFDSQGTFIKPSALPEEYGTSRIPTGWTVINK